MQSNPSNPQAIGSPRDPARLRAHRRGVAGKARVAAVALLVLTGMALSPGAARADITYTLNESAALFGSVTTDGHTGSLSAGDILNWQFEVAGLEVSGSGATIAVGVSATSSALFFDLSDTSSELRLQQDSNNFLDVKAGTSGDPDFPYQFQITLDAASGAQFAHDKLNLNYDATKLTIAAVSSPEPSTGALAVLGAVAFIAHGWIRHRRNQRREGAA